MFSPILLLAGRFLLASALLMTLYWVVWRKQATYRAKRMYLLTMPIVALAISLLQVEVYKPEPVVVEVMSGPTGPNEPIGPSPIPSQGRGVDTAPIMNLPIENEANSASLSEEQGISLPPLGEGKGWGPWGPWNLALLLYALIILLFCIPFVVNLVLVRRLRKEASGTEEEKETGIRILTGEGVQAPFSFHRTIFLPVNLTETQRRMILAHERAHILHRHYVDVWVAEGITRLLWWNPFLWWARQELRNVHEFEADSEVLGTGEDVYAYQAILIEEVLHGDIVIANGFNHSFIRRRFVEMLQSTNRRMSSMAKAGTAAWMLFVIALMCCTVGEAETVYKVKEQRTLPSLPQGEGVDSPVVSEQQGITAKEEKEVPTTAFEESFITSDTAGLGRIPKEIGQLLDIQKTIAESAIDTSYQAQNEALLCFIANWFELSENGVFLSESEYEKKNIDMEEYPSYEEYSKHWSGNIVLETQLLSSYLSRLNDEIRPQAEKLIKQYGWIIPREKDLYITIRSDAFNKTWTFKKRPRSSGITVGPLTEQEILRIKEDAASKINKQLFMCFISWGLYYSPNISGVSYDEYKIAKKIQPDLPKASEVNQSKELTWTVKQLYIEHLLKDVNEGVANQVRNVIKKYSTDDYLGKELYFTIDLGTHEIHVKKEKGKELTSQFLWEKGKPLPEGFLPSEKDKAATNTSANEPAITNNASLREQDEALQMFFRGWCDMNKSSQEPMLTEEEFQQAIKTEPIPPGFDPSYKAYKERTKNFIAEAKKKMEEGRARLNKEIRPQVEAVLKQHGMKFPPERQLKIIIRAAYKNATWEFMNNPNAYGCAVNKNFLIVDDPSSPDYNKGKASATPQTHHIQEVHLPTAPFTYSEYLQLTPKYHLVRYADETHLVCYECPKSDKEIISLHREMYLTDTATGDKYMLRRVQGIANDVQSVEVNNYREVPLQVTYVFPPLGSKVKEVTLNFPHKENQTHKVKSLERASIKTIRDKALQAACTHPVEKSDKPDNSAPTLKRPKAAGYNVQDENSFPAYTDVYTTYQQVFHNDKDHYRIYRGKGCTYVTVAYKVRWEWEFFNFSDDMMLIDPKTGDRYMIAGVEHFPLDTHFWVVGQQGEYIRFVLVFPALPEKVTTVDLFEGGMQRRANTDGAKRYQGLTVRSEYTSPDREKQGRVIY
ncbi:MAG: hypothetical protein IJB28_06745 [Bacteroidaceae bacterium]|nr:hypothetical protein [Bacteroidaceae bacterium]